jgi:HEAT repeat protein
MPPSREELVALTQDPSAFLHDGDWMLRRMAVSALSVTDAPNHLDDLTVLASDAHEAVRTATAEKLGWCGPDASTILRTLQVDAADPVREAVATAYGENGDTTAIPWLIEVGRRDENRQVREAAVAALGAIGDPAAVDHLLELIRSGPPQVRRRAIAAITVFDDPRIEPAIRMAALDRNPGVKEAAEMVVGRQIAVITDHESEITD